MNFKKAFPVFEHHPTLHFLDSGASTQKPKVVIEALTRFYESSFANIHRGVYQLSQDATVAYDLARQKVQRFLGAASEKEIVFVRGTTEAINLVATSYAKPLLKPEDTILVTALEHHANLIPWQEVAKATGATLRIIPITDTCDIDLAAYAQLLRDYRPKVVALTHVSNAIGTILPIQAMTAHAKAVGATVLIDGAQAVPHLKVDVQALGCDFYVFSGHKLYGPTGIGVLYGKQALLDAMPPYQVGGDMIETVTYESATYAQTPARFEAGTPAIAEAVGLGAALDFLGDIGFETLYAHEQSLLQEAKAKLSAIEGVRLVGSPNQQSGVISFTIDGVHPHDIGTIFDDCNVAIRAGHHCAQPLMKLLNLPATARISFGVYNDSSDCDAAVAAIHRVKELFL
ncbi:MAG: aminotransferase class V-fold PLP-dependent enzyme [Candidatus Margulisiibacteriota bacterium]